ncbi:AcrZ family multidrug efflux pump-associated protein, partial [Acerihabitans sp.]|uniref:AcrZ family multidrug efflux pump-associated protein n=1 Tax=Acerihabitans sp. TaxID=2811394 RepID=UPI002ED83380
MLELLESLLMVVLMVPVVMVLILGSIYGLGELFNLISKIGKPKQKRDPHANDKRGADAH